LLSSFTIARESGEAGDLLDEIILVETMLSSIERAGMLDRF
jgi:hypothetical protein